MKYPPVVSVVIPVYSGGRFLGPAIDSVLSQTFQDFEILLIDNNAPETTADIIRAYAERYPDKIRMIRETHRGVSAARNRGILESKGEYVALLDDDDLMLPERLERQVAVALDNPGLSLIFCGHHAIDAKDGSIVRQDIFGAQGRWKESERMVRSLLSAILPDRNLDSFQFAFPSTMFFGREKAIRAGLFHDQLLREEDSHFCLKMFLEGDFAMVGECLVLFLEKRNEENIFRNMEFVTRHVTELQKYYRIVCEFFLGECPSMRTILEREYAAFVLDDIATNLVRFVKTGEDLALIRTLFFQAWKKSGFKRSRLKPFVKSLFPRSFYPRLFWFDNFFPGRIDHSILSLKQFQQGLAVPPVVSASEVGLSFRR